MNFWFFLVLLSAHGSKGEVSAECGVVVPGPERCQAKAARIVGGNETSPNEYPHQVSIQVYDSSDKIWYHGCGGSIVAADKIVTSGLCTYHLTQGNASDLSHIRVVAGDHNPYVSEGTEQCRSIKSLVTHPKFSAYKLHFDYDYGVIRLAEPFTLDAFVDTIAITKDEPEAGDCVTLGWGNINEDGDFEFPCALHHVTVPLVPGEKCEQIYQGEEIITKQMICAGTAGKGFCLNDNGGPLVCKGSLAGIVSFINHPCPPTQPNVYASVTAVLPWLNAQ